MILISDFESPQNLNPENICGVTLSQPYSRVRISDIHSKSDRPDMKIPSSDPESAHQIDPDDI